MPGSFLDFLILFNEMNGTKILVASNQLENVFISHTRDLDKLENYRDFHKMTTNKVNWIFHESDKLSSDFLIRRTNEKLDGSNV